MKPGVTSAVDPRRGLSLPEKFRIWKLSKMNVDLRLVRSDIATRRNARGNIPAPDKDIVKREYERWHRDA